MRPHGFPTEDGQEVERYELHEAPRYRFELNRRAFVQVLGAGILVTATAGKATAQRRGGDDEAQSISARLHLGEDGMITVMTSKVEAGQGSRTQITQAAAEELRVSVDQVTLIMADTALVPNDGGTYGSLTTPRTVPSVRRAAAAARELLIQAGAAKWNVKPETVTLKDGHVVHEKSVRHARYAELAASSALGEGTVPEEVEVTQVKDWRVLGTSVLRTTGRDIVTGAHRYPSDIIRPEMVYAKVLRPPSYGATLNTIDLGPAQAMDNVSVVRDGNFVACTAPTSFQAAKAVEVIAPSAKWIEEPQPSSKELFTHLKEFAVDGGGGRRGRAREEGSVDDAMASAAKVVKAVYEVPYIQHAPMEPRAAVAEWDGDNVTVWTGTQRPHGVREEVAEAMSVPEDHVRVIVPDTGGGFGGKHTGDAAVEAARIAKAAGQPVSLRWTREEEFTWAYFRPAGLIETAAGLDEDGHVVAWDFTNINSGGSSIETPYTIAHARSKVMRSDSPLRMGSYRCLAAAANSFARESFMDELAVLTGADPLAFRLAHLDDPRLRAVLESAAKEFQWTQRKGTSDRHVGVGLSCSIDKDSFVAACAAVRVDPATGKVRVLKVTQAFECGAIQNPANLRSQVEGAVIMGLGGATTEAMEFENGRILNGSFKQYKVPRFKDLPELDIHLLNRPDLESVGAGETPLIAVAPAIANAVYDATGYRPRAMPVRGRAEA